MNRLPSIITQKPITRGLAFDLSDVLMRFKESPGKQLLQRMQKQLQLNELHGTKIPAICDHLSSKSLEYQLTREWATTIPLLQTHWPDFGYQHNVNFRLWWKNAVYNILNNMNIIEDPYQNIREKTGELQLISAEDAAADGFARTDGIMVNVFDTDFPHINIQFNFDEYFEELYADFCDPLSYELYPDTRAFIDYIFGHYKDEVLVGCATHDMFCCQPPVLEEFKLDYLDFYITPQNAKCSKPSKRFYEITKINIYETIQQRMIDAEIDKLYGNKFSLYDRMHRSEMMTKRADQTYALHEHDIKEAYHGHFHQMLNPNEMDVIMVGNSIRDDVLPSLDMGWKAVWLVRPITAKVLNKDLTECKEELDRIGTKKFGSTLWNEYRQRVLVVSNLFDIHHNAFLWD